MNKKIIVFTDGSCFGNGLYNAYGGIGVHFPNGELPDINKVYRKNQCTNQKAEFYAILYAIRYIQQHINLNKNQLVIKTDSMYSINCITKWIYKWSNNGWKTTANAPVANKEFIQKIYKYYAKYDIIFEHVDAHTGGTDPDSIGNDIADKLAKKAAKRAVIDMDKTHIVDKKNDTKEPDESFIQLMNSINKRPAILSNTKNKMSRTSYTNNKIVGKEFDAKESDEKIVQLINSMDKHSIELSDSDTENKILLKKKNKLYEPKKNPNYSYSKYERYRRYEPVIEVELVSAD